MPVSALGLRGQRAPDVSGRRSCRGVEAGDAFYLAPGHIPVQNEPRSEFVQFSPTKELRETQAVMRANFEAMQVA